MNNQPTDYALIESVLGGNKNDFRTLLQNLVLNQHTLASATGTQFGQKASNVATPSQASIGVAGANAAFTVTIVNPTQGNPGTIWHEVSYSTVKGFTSDVTTLAPTTSTSMVLNIPNQSLFFRVRSSFNRQTWNDYQLAGQSAVASGLVSSAVTTAGGAFNQTNFGVVTSTATGSSAAVLVQGAGGALTSMVALKGKNQSVLPAATIIGVEPGSEQFVGWTGRSYLLRPTLAAVLDDDLTPVGKVSVVSTATPTLPTIVPVISGGAIVGYEVTNGGAGATGPYTLAYGAVGTGVGATFGEQTITAGVLISIAPGNPGHGYAGTTTVTATGGGVSPGVPGGGTAIGGNGGRLTAV